MPRVAPQNWRPSGVDDLEPEAWRALRHPGCACVIAGPGAGKTEFLAQRAVYLLETGICPAPRRVLAISFKTDAAANLAARVHKRCPAPLAARFVSLTFDAFTKSLVDRFRSSLPTNWRPSGPYDIAFPKPQQIDGFLDVTRLEAPQAWQAAIATLKASTFEPRVVGSYRLPVTPTPATSGVEHAIQKWWHAQLHGRARSQLTFVSLNRLAELLLRANSQIRRALQATYRFVFVDEFQDTTYAQYDFLLSAFSTNAIAVTAVGDDKQRIMSWAGARPDAFQSFESDFAAQRFQLEFNFRSSPDLVRIQHVVARRLDPSAVPTTAQVASQVDGDVAQVWNSPTIADEAKHLARWIREDMTQRRRVPRDYALLVRQKADAFESDLGEAFVAASLHIRNESKPLGKTTLQDLLSEELTRLSVALLRLGTTRRVPSAWQTASSIVQDLRGVQSDDEAGCQRLETELTSFVAELRAFLADTVPTRENASVVTSRLFEFLDLAAVARVFLQYRTGDLLKILVDAFNEHLTACADVADDWSACLDMFDGVSQIPLMTVHKSKGLEYDTIVFIGLDDQAWWSHTPENPEGLATFFVALSRAKQRAIFAFCPQRGSRARVADLYDLLAEANVPEIKIPGS